MKSIDNRAPIAGALLALACAVHAESIDPALTAPQKAQAARGLHSLQSPARGSEPSGKIDHTAPTLVSFTLKPPKDVAAPFAQVVLDVSATDDLSGVYYYHGYLTGPHGQQLEMLYGIYGSNVPARRFEGAAGATTNAYIEPGNWTIQALTLVDLEGNAMDYSTGDLALYGNPTVVLVNSKAALVDDTPPTLVSGKVLTPTMSMSSHPRGTDTVAPSVYSEFVIADAGSGAASALAIWRNDVLGTAIETYGELSVSGLAKSTIQTASQLYDDGGNPPGTYNLQSLRMTDAAGNRVTLLSVDYGGDTDFSIYMPNGHQIVITP